MLARFKRLNLKKDFKWVSFGKKTDSKYARLLIRFGDNQSPRIGIATVSKIFTKSNERQRAKRVLSSVFESIYLKLPKNINIVALPKASIVGVKSSTVLLDLQGVLTDEKVIDTAN